MIRLSTALIVTAWILLPSDAAAHGLSQFTRQTTSYYSSPVICMPICFYTVPTCPSYPFSRELLPRPQASTLPLPSPTAGTSRPTQTLAPPTAAPPSAAPATSEPPRIAPRTSISPSIGQLPATVSESRSFYDTYAVAPGDAGKPVGDKCSVEVWNLTGRALILRIDGLSREMGPNGRALVDVNRQFVWQVEGRDPQRETIAAGETALEIVIRR